MTYTAVIATRLRNIRIITENNGGLVRKQTFHTQISRVGTLICTIPYGAIQRGTLVGPEDTLAQDTSKSLAAPAAPELENRHSVCGMDQVGELVLLLVGVFCGFIGGGVPHGYTE